MNISIDRNEEKSKEMTWEELRKKWNIDDKRLVDLCKVDDTNSRDIDQIKIKKLILIDRILLSIYGQELASDWVNLPNKNTIFQGKAPIEFILGGDDTCINAVVQLLYGRYVTT